VAARVQAIAQVHSLDELLEDLEAAGPQRCCWCWTASPTRTTWAPACAWPMARAHAVIAPKDHAAGINATVAKVASGAAETVPYFMVTNLARTMGELKERNIWIIGTSDDAPQTLYQADLKGPWRWCWGRGHRHAPAHAQNLRRAGQIPMKGAVESLNVSVASGICLYEALRQRGHGYG
jgi:23S rRNA (guanosine2251-2'-O)-methyltransferase